MCNMALPARSGPSRSGVPKGQVPFGGPKGKVPYGGPKGPVPHQLDDQKDRSLMSMEYQRTMSMEDLKDRSLMEDQKDRSPMEPKGPVPHQLDDQKDRTQTVACHIKSTPAATPFKQRYLSFPCSEDGCKNKN